MSSKFIIIIGMAIGAFSIAMAPTAKADAPAAPAQEAPAIEKAPAKEVKHEADQGLERYYSRDYRFSVSFPSTWELAVDEDATSLGALSPREGATDTFRENALVGSFDLGANLTLTDYFNGNLDYLKEKIADLKVLSTDHIKVGGLEAIKVIYTSTIEGKHYKTMQIFIIKDGRGYIITAMGDVNNFDKFMDNFNAVVNSFHFE